MPKQENGNDVVEPHAHIDGGDILNFTYCNLLSHTSFQMFFFFFFGVKFVIMIPYLIVVLKPLAHLPSAYEKVSGPFFLLKVFKQY